MKYTKKHSKTKKGGKNKIFGCNQYYQYLGNVFPYLFLKNYTRLILDLDYCIPINDGEGESDERYFENFLKTIKYFINLIDFDITAKYRMPIPESLWTLTKLQKLRMRDWIKDNTLSENIGNLVNLNSLDVPRNHLTKLPENIGNLVNLTILNVSGNDLIELPESIVKLSNLTDLYLSNNKLTDLPESIKHPRLHNPMTFFNLPKTDIDPSNYINLHNLIKLTLFNNQFTQLPESIGNLTKLKYLDLSNNQLTQLPESIGNLTKLENLYLHNNRLTQLPESIGKLSNLINLDIRFNQITSLPESIGNLTKIYLDLSDNHLSEIPESIWNMWRLNNLECLTLSNNHFTQFPESIEILTNLEYLDLSNNQLTQLPESIGNLTNLNTLMLSTNQLTQLPESIGNLTLEYLYLINNRLTQLPESFGNLNNLQYLDISGNPIRTLPNLISLRSLTIDNTNIVINNLPVRLRELLQAEANNIHKAFNKINIKKYMNIIEKNTTNKNYNQQSQQNFLTEIYTRMSNFINQQTFTPTSTQTSEEIKSSYIEHLNSLFNTLKICTILNEGNSKQLIGKTLDFVFQQPPMFIEIYLTTWITDNKFAHTTGDPSCVKGMIERIVTLVAETIISYCSTITETTTPQEETKEKQEEKTPEPTTPSTQCGVEGSVYEELLLVLNKKIDKNELTQEWATKMEENVPAYQTMNASERKNNYIQFMTQKYKDFYDKHVLDEDVINLIEEEANKFDYVFSNDEGAIFGGNRTRKHRKYRSGRKRRRLNTLPTRKRR